MSWLASILVAVLTAAVGTLAGGYVASLCVDWYHISGREGGSGYFIVAMGLLGLLTGVVVGLVAARVVAAHPDPGFLKALGLALGVHLGVIGAIGAVARLVADIPPTIDGEMLLLAVELRYPAEWTTSPATDTTEGYLELHSVPAFSHTVRATERGALWKEDAHLVDGRWVVPGAVNVFTSRGSRMLSVHLGDDSVDGFLVPLPGHPGRRDLAWSDWLPREGKGGPPRAKGLNYRFRVQRWSEPVRTQAVGKFEVQTIASQFYEEAVDGKNTTVAVARFRVRFGGQPVVMGSDSAAESVDADQVAVLPGPAPALLVHLDPAQASGECYLLSADDLRARVDSLPGCGGVSQPEILTSDNERFHAGQKVKPVRGRIDRVSFQQPGLFLLGHTVLDTRSLAVRPFTPDTVYVGIPAVPPLALSPDGRSFVRFAYGPNADGLNSEEFPALVVTDLVAGHHYARPIDAARMRFPDFEALDPAWVDHHFTWERGADGVDLLVQRTHFTPIPYHGALKVEEGGYSYYRIEKAGEALRAALIDFLVSEFKAERQPADSGAYEVPVKIDGRTVNVARSGDFGYVMVSLERGATDSTLVPAIAARFDAALATGRYDAMFTR